MPNFNTHVRADYGDHIHSFLEKKFLERLVAEMHLSNYGIKKSMPSHGGTV